MSTKIKFHHFEFGQILLSPKQVFELGFNDAKNTRLTLKKRPNYGRQNEQFYAIYMKGFNAL